MQIKTVSIKNFRAIHELKSFELKNLSILIGDNGTSKTSILEGINYCLSPSFLSGRIKHTDFYKGLDNPIEIRLEFDKNFTAFLPDGYSKQEIPCKGVFLRIKKRDRAGSGKSFSDMVVVEHYVIPVQERTGDKGWEIKRKGTGTTFKFDYRLLSHPVETEGLLRSYFYGKNRGKQLQPGFNSSISSVYEDFNWRFLKELRKEVPQTQEATSPDYFSRKREIEDEILDTIDEKSTEKTLTELNNKLEAFGLENVGVSFFNSHTPFDSAFLNQRLDKLEIPVSQLGSGIEMIISLLFLETLASLSKEEFVVIIDEPELHLHPVLQDKFIKYLIDLSEDNQVILSTHSPYFFKNCISNRNNELLVTTKDKGAVVVSNTGQSFGLFPWSPSWGEINFVAYNLPTIEFHNELYGFLQEKNSALKEAEIESFFETKGAAKSKQWIKQQASGPGSPCAVTLMTYIRHTIHHPENTNNPPFTTAELEVSIKSMIAMV